MRIILLVDDLVEVLKNYETVFAPDDDLGRFNHECMKSFINGPEIKLSKATVRYVTSLFHINDDGSVACKEFREVR